MYLISDNIDTLTGMRLAGVDGIVVHEREELRCAIENAMEDKDVGVILLTEKFGREFPDLIDEIKLERTMPLLIEIPDRHGTGRTIIHAPCNGGNSDVFRISGPRRNRNLINL